MGLQLPLNVQLRDTTTLTNYFAGVNQEPVERLRESVRGRASEGAIYLWGGEGTGKTHLLQAACQQAAENDLAATYLPLAQCQDMHVDMLQGLEEIQLICIDDLQAIAGQADWEEALFHLFNRCFDSGTQLVFAAEHNIAGVGLSLADLASRLAWGFVFHLRVLDDDEKVKALQLRALQRGVELPEASGQYLIRHCPRDMESLFSTLDALDTASLMAQRKLTVPFIKAWLNQQSSPDAQASLF